MTLLMLCFPSRETTRSKKFVERSQHRSLHKFHYSQYLLLAPPIFPESLGQFQLFSFPTMASDWKTLLSITALV